MNQKIFARVFLIIAACMSVFSSQTSWAIELYKYTNEDGVTVLDSRIPPKYVKSGYTIISADGRVIEVVARALTDAEIKERDKKAAIDKALQEERERQADVDATLLRLYSTPEDVIRARDTKLATINGFIKTAQGNLERNVEQKRQLEGEAADAERAGSTVPQENIERIQIITDRINQIGTEIDNKSLEIQTVTEKYGRDLERLKQLRDAGRTKKSGS